MTDDAPDSAEPDEVPDPSGANLDEPAASEGRTRGRAVDVPLQVYKVVTVFSTLFAIVAVVVGFVLLDWGTNRARADPSEVHLGVVVAGLLAIALGAVTYAFSTRFRAEGMGPDGGKGKG